MPQELDHIIERIRQEGVDEAEKRSEEIISSARKQAASMIDDARAEADRILAEAEEKTKSIEKRSMAALDQAARDLLLTIEEAVENIFEDLIHEAVDQSMDQTLVRDVLTRVIGECFTGHDEGGMEVLLSQEDGQELVEFFATKYKEKMDKGLELRTDSEVLKGFRISFKDKNVYLDYTSEAVAEALANFLRPRLAEIVKCAAQVHDGVASACDEISERRSGQDDQQHGKEG